MANQVKFKEETINVGDTIRVEQKIKEGNKERTQAFEGIILRIKGSSENKSITVRRIAIGGIGVEKIWPLSSPSLQSIKVIKRGHVRRAKLYYLRKRVGKKATRIKQRLENKTQEKKPAKDEPKKKKPRKTRRTTGKKTSKK